MPTPRGLPKAGEVWERTIRTPHTEPATVRAVVLERSRGDYWSLRVYIPGAGPRLWVDPAYWLSRGLLRYIGPAGPQTRRKLNLR
jgi:hypothetical protein